ncbi:hypothetical protein ABPG72_013514 [Tetrahymena utriculariae]
MGNKKSISYNDQFFISYGLKSLRQYLDNVKNDMKVNIDSPDLQCIDYLQHKISNLTDQITSLSLKSTLQTKEIFPIDNILSIFQQFSKKNDLNQLSIRFEFLQLKQQHFQKLIEYIKDLTNLSLLDLRLNNDLLDLSSFNFLQCQSLCLRNKNNLKQLDLLFSFKNIKINKENFEIYLEAFSQLVSIEHFNIQIENMTYSDIALDIIYSLIQHNNLQTLFIDIVQFDFNNGVGQLQTQTFLKYEDNKQHIFNSNLKKLTVTKLRCNNSHVIFSLASNLQQLETLNVTLIPTIDQNSEKPIRQIQEFSSNKKQLQNLIIQFEYEISKESMCELVVSYLSKFKANYFKLSLPSQRYYNYFDRKYIYQIEKSLLSVCWNEVEIGTDSTFFQTINKYITQKQIIIAQYAIFQKFQKQYMICNPQLIFLDLYIN